MLRQKERAALDQVHLRYQSGDLVASWRDVNDIDPFRPQRLNEALANRRLFDDKSAPTVLSLIAKICSISSGYLRGLFVAGALAVIRYAKIHGTKHRPWLTGLLARRPVKVAAIALANKIARMAWAMMARGVRYKEPVALAA